VDLKVEEQTPDMNDGDEGSDELCAAHINSAAGAADSGMICEDFVLKRGRLNVELLANLDQVPPVGAIVFVAFPLQGNDRVP
jgi:kynurenine formamidase